MSITPRSIPDYESFSTRSAILQGPCMVDDKGDLVKISRFRSIWDTTIGLGWRDQTRQELVDIERKWVKLCDKLVSGGKGTEQDQIEIARAVDEVLNQSKYPREIIDKIAKRFFEDALMISKKEPLIKSKILSVLVDIESHLKTDEIASLAKQHLEQSVSAELPSSKIAVGGIPEKTLFHELPSHNKVNKEKSKKEDTGEGLGFSDDSGNEEDLAGSSGGSGQQQHPQQELISLKDQAQIPSDEQIGSQPSPLASRSSLTSHDQGVSRLGKLADHYLEGSEKVDKSMEELNDQFEKQIRLSDLSTSGIPALT